MGKYASIERGMINIDQINIRKHPYVLDVNSGGAKRHLYESEKDKLPILMVWIKALKRHTHCEMESCGVSKEARRMWI